MSQTRKLFQKIKENPKNVRFEDINKLLGYYGFVIREPRSGSSHVTYYHPKLAEILTIPKHRPHIKPVYIKRALRLIEMLEKRGEE
ncbi:type II toxin-antitoxin system HicA family toxin [Thermoanaerobacter sp. CM-CNRG TB177]|jgi:predicted RNA binding protein YcfA (HicA-like mRNA interferase family)|uniref:type II toxin-antitoxin system HicA family toxin n=1 Tax=Thermoanaerobacter sp. CM-CNRG TB177 TaxID=2800659 RepID=UPI001BDEA15C|nr:type II toxin-antitoxin system HicA family toxin [Thermoanaerobacter sp. CM-CNRG TB177]MBT1278938.1 type II toxin-antitoxin system HicA family toxin [Thermoanaerobacter sp. CM-CNRG TB177]